MIQARVGLPGRRTIGALLLCAAVLPSLSGCVGMVVGATAAGAVASLDRRTLGAQTDDKTIAVKVELRVPNIAGTTGHVNVTSYNRKVLLTGEVKNEEIKAAVEREVRSVDGVLGVFNELVVADPSTYSERTSDALITTKVKTKFIEVPEISTTSFKVVTERGAVFLMGRVTAREGQLAAEAARTISGVTKVVKVFEYITEEELKAIKPQPGQAAQAGSSARG
jgi:osmotically-inducible protein OsmY